MVKAARWEVRLVGEVQGVGMRPALFRLASQLGLAGCVCNRGAEVWLEIEGPLHRLQQFWLRLDEVVPPGAQIRQRWYGPVPVQGQKSMVIGSSLPGEGGLPFPPDRGPCPDCLRELLDVSDRHSFYPLLNCTRCGPRYTVVLDLPYDRAHTTLSPFELCSSCRRAYEDPLDRRFHAQPTACPLCGPQLVSRPVGLSPLAWARQLLLAGQTVAVKGVGGYHLMGRADLSSTVQELRRLKRRPHRPLVVMVADLSSARNWSRLSPEQEAFLDSPERPILLVPCLQPQEELAPGLGHIGLMLPPSPLHVLLLQPPLQALVVTSCNAPQEPIAFRHPPDFWQGPVLDHQRPIAAACEDSVYQWGPRGAYPLRRSRGWVPRPIQVGLHLPPMLAVGGELKNVLALARDHQVWLGTHLGDMSSEATLQRLGEEVGRWCRLLQLDPQWWVADWHPGYLSTRWAEEQARLRQRPLVKVQHHHAHLAALLGEHAWPQHESALGLVFDGHGWGLDDTLWGGEVLLGSYAAVQRLAWFEPVTVPGGDAALRFPYRLALSYLHQAGLEWHEQLPCVAAARPDELRNLTRLPGVVSSSLGRLFDAVASLLGFCQEVSYEGQAASWLEAACDPDESGMVPFAIEGDRIVWAEALDELVKGWRRGVPAGRLATRFHNGLVELISQLARRFGEGRAIALSGGCFHNLRLLGGAVERLEREGHRVLIHRQVPCGDGGLALGQALVASQCV